MRKIVQIATTSPAVAVGKSFLSAIKVTVPAHVFALCDDGSVWANGFDPKNGKPTEWERIPDVPQD